MAAILMASCSVFEDRSQCPDFIALDLDYLADRSDNASLRLMYWNDDRLVETSDVSYTPAKHEYDIPVSDGMVDIVALSPCDSARFDEEQKRILIPLGEQHHPFYGLARRVYVDGEDTYFSGVRLYKQFTRLRFKLRRVPYYDYTVSVVSDVCGLYTQTLEPVRGSFLYEFPLNEEIYECVVPRQMPDGRLDIVIKNRTHSSDTPDIAISLGESLRRESYDWSYPELSDIYAYVDVSKEITIIQIMQ